MEDSLLDVIGRYDNAELDELEAFVWSLHHFVVEVVCGQQEEE